ncbi:DNA polymerase III subunit chi [Acetobacter nitrogenifigens DSM 23921 = NBRC 105050]|uniref:DNA polymerase III subunit chi n=1 Tax=Acetobacter nitrogenifigens DSM 23921 = NBRC 105050 TaxID=1120919 RepID=A0A511X9I4_9PROT|nr:DNA polymerase III subunit chi [Acetobacter nitrogenifigens]GBQ93462.1 DNA polymerase III subunit chi [Acetobacter nitrogenifigens DSM 23921 = NBRC 105050]GEN59571.1 DNA polymerase III subunit chi [Acetobacter nitrogenifigens DSM 23921 = NBRC 105050]
MAEIGFYHLTRTTADEALPQLLGRTLDAGKRAVVRCGESVDVASLDEALWRVSEPVWLPHAATGAKFPDRQPIWITSGDDTPNTATYLFLLGAREAEKLEAFERIFDLFDGRDDMAVAAARRRWSALKAQGHSLTYWRQGEKGWSKAG